VYFDLLERPRDVEVIASGNSIREINRSCIGIKPTESAAMSTKSSNISIRRIPRSRRARYYVLCIENAGYEASLETRKIYVAIPDADAATEEQVRVVDESGEDYLFPAEYFKPISVAPSIVRLLQRTV
jgi:hypothetical protein